MEKNNRIIRGMLAGGVGLLLLCLLAAINLKGYQDTVGRDRMKKEVTYFRDFSLPTPDGGSFGTEDLAGHKLIVLNGWGPWCSSCVAEMPELEELSEELKEQGVLVAGIVADYSHNLENGMTDYLEQVETSVANTGVTYPILLADQEFYDQVVPMMNGAYPGTWFLTEDGTVVGFISGSRNKEEWKKTIESILDEEGLR